jgi:hypothetical protein
MNAEQYRALVNKLEAINNPQQLDELKIGDINPVTGKRIVSGMTDGEGNLVGSGTPGVYWNAKEEPVDTPAPTPEPTPNPEPSPEPTPNPEPSPEPTPDGNKEEKGGCDPETLAKIKYMPSFNQAFAAARQAGCDTFQWCGVYRTKTQGGKAKPLGWEANRGQNTAGGAGVGNPSITAQGRKAGATQVPDVPVQKASAYKLSPSEAQNVLANGQPNDIARYGGAAELQKIVNSGRPARA